MQKLEVVLASAIQNGETVTIAKAHNLALSFQPMGGSNESLSDGNISITGKQSLTLQNGQVITADLNPINVRLAEREAKLLIMPAGAEKVAAQAEFDIWNTCLTSIQSALSIALKADYELKNPTV